MPACRVAPAFGRRCCSLVALTAVHQDPVLRHDHDHGRDRSDHPQDPAAPDGPGPALGTAVDRSHRPRQHRRRHHQRHRGADAGEQHAGLHRAGRGAHLLCRDLRRLSVDRGHRHHHRHRHHRRGDLPLQEQAPGRGEAALGGVGAPPVRPPHRFPRRLQGGAAQQRRAATICSTTPSTCRARPPTSRSIPRPKPSR